MGIVSIILGIFAIGIIALIHEVGHYFFARRAGIKVLELSIGAGPKIVSFIKNDTQYTIRPIPFLAYVRLEEDGPGSVSEASAFQKFLLYIGGVFFNIMTAFLILILVGIFSGVYTNKVIVGDLIKDKPAINILQKNDQIIAINNTKIDGYKSLETQLAKYGDSEIELTILRNNNKENLNIVPVLDKENDRYILGFYFAKEKLNILTSITHSVNIIWEYVSQTFVMLGNLVTGNSKPSENLVGIVGIVAISSDFTSKISDYMIFIAVISIGMAIVNILPIPALDGGKIVLLAVEKVIGRKINKEFEAKLTFVGLALLILLMVFTTVNDVMKLFGG